MAIKQPEPWLRGAIPGIPTLLQPVAHALVHSQENLTQVVPQLSQTQLWRSVGGTASVGFHLLHLSGSTDRLFTYARGEELSDQQRDQLAAEQGGATPQPSAQELLDNWSSTVEESLARLRGTPVSDLLEVRYVGRARLESTVLGLLFHAAEHASRHTGQIVTTARIVIGEPSQ
ncbi:MAG: DinB family protein [Rhodothermales bacterium]|nr:DinB family protein [Rhodothermales bacterium]